MNVKIKTLCLLIFVTLSLTLIPTSNCREDYDPVYINVNLQVLDINPENYTIFASLAVEIYNYPKNSNQIVLSFLNDDEYEINCSRVNTNGAIYYTGKLEPRYWYLTTFGELYPFDFNQAILKFDQAIFCYEPDLADSEPNFHYTLNITDSTVNFDGFQWTDYLKNWQVSTVNSGNQLAIYFQRIQQNAQYTIIIPLLGILIVMTSMPALSSNKKIKIEFYSSMLFFVPVFIFTIQGFIPQRSSLSIPEYLAFSLILSALLMIIFTIPNHNTEKKSRNSELIGLMASLGLTYFLGLWIFSKLLSAWQTCMPIAVILIGLSIIFGLAAILRESAYINYKQKQQKIMADQMKEYCPEDFSH
jgi:hypothetical protein